MEINTENSGFSRSEYVKERQFWLERQQNETLSRDRTLMTLSSSALAFITIAIGEWYPLNELSHGGFVLVFATWLSFLICVLSNVYSYFSSEKMITSIVKQLDSRVAGNEDKSEKGFRNSTRINSILNKASLIGFSLGAIGLTLIVFFH